MSPFIVLSILLISFSCLVFADGETGDLRDTADQDAPLRRWGEEKTGFPFGTGTSEGAQFGPSLDKGNAQGQGAFKSNEAKYGPKGLKRSDLVKSDQSHVTRDTLQEAKVREFLTEYIDFKGTPEQNSEHRKATSVEDWICTFEGDSREYTAEECDVFMNLLLNTQTFSIVVTIGEVHVAGKDAIAFLTGEPTGEPQGISIMADGSAYNFQWTLKKFFNEWKISERKQVSGDGTADIIQRFKQQVMKQLRGSILSSKLYYPAYNPVVIVAGSAIASLLGIVFFGVWIFRKRRRSYEKVDSMSVA